LFIYFCRKHWCSVSVEETPDHGLIPSFIYITRGRNPPQFLQCFGLIICLLLSLLCQAAHHQYQSDPDRSGPGLSGQSSLTLSLSLTHTHTHTHAHTQTHLHHCPHPSCVSSLSRRLPWRGKRGLDGQEERRQRACDPTMAGSDFKSLQIRSNTPTQNQRANKHPLQHKQCQINGARPQKPLKTAAPFIICHRTADNKVIKTLFFIVLDTHWVNILNLLNHMLNPKCFNHNYLLFWLFFKVMRHCSVF